MKEGGGKDSAGEEISENFIAEMNRLMEEESSGALPTVHLTHSDFNPRDLRPEDEKIWEDVKSGTITREEFDAYREATRIGNANSSVETFSAFIANKTMPILVEREMREMGL